ncbi:epithelial splicing regulatory protein 2 [Pelomyxa schiedti]|nr:epithelial splicing regulatory protein 2 [Pelomyxa schiedti]
MLITRGGHSTQYYLYAAITCKVRYPSQSGPYLDSPALQFSMQAAGAPPSAPPSADATRTRGPSRGAAAAVSRPRPSLSPAASSAQPTAGAAAAATTTAAGSQRQPPLSSNPALQALQPQQQVVVGGGGGGDQATQKQLGGETKPAAAVDGPANSASSDFIPLGSSSSVASTAATTAPNKPAASGEAARGTPSEFVVVSAFSKKKEDVKLSTDHIAWIIVDLQRSMVISRNVVVLISQEGSTPVENMTQEDSYRTSVGSALSLSDALCQLTIQVQHIVEKEICMITAGEWADSMLLPRDTSLQPVMPHVNLLKKCSSAYNKDFPNLNAILDQLSIERDSSTCPFSALDICLTISKVLFHMTKEGHHFYLEKPTPPEAQIQQRNNFYPQNAEAPAPESIVKLRGLPWQATDRDIESFFNGLHIVKGHGIRIILNQHGRPSGEAYVEFTNELDAEKALARNKQHMAHRYIEIFKATRAELTRALAPKAPNIASSFAVLSALCDPTTDYNYQGVLRLRGLPFSASTEDIQQFFMGFDVQPQNVHIMQNADGRNTGDAYVEFSTEDLATRALLSRNKAVLGNRYIELFRCTKGELLSILEHKMGGIYGMYAALGASSGTDPNSSEGGGRKNEMVCVRVRGLPYSATEHDIVNFFSGLTIATNGIHFVFNENERPSGEAYVEFATEEDAQRAMAKHKEQILNRYIEVFRCSKSEVQWVLNGRSRIPNQRFLSYGTPGLMGLYSYPPSFQGLYGGWPPSQIPPDYGLPMFPQFNPTFPQQTSPDTQNYYSYFPQPVSSDPSLLAHASPTQPAEDGISSQQLVLLQQLCLAGCVVRIRGLPFSATPNDVAVFFNGYDILRQTIHIQAPDGRPNGDCLVAFSSPQEASRAVHERNNAMMGSRRYLELSLASSI